MAENSAIEWTDHTFNPWIGCQEASPGCKHCYAADWAKRYGRDFAQRTRTSEANWKQPLKWNAQAEREGRRFRVFCASLADVFDNQARAEWRLDLFRLIRQTPHLDWLLLTKRIGNVEKMLAEALDACFKQGDTESGLDVWLFRWLNAESAPRNVWLGATVVNQEETDRDIPKLLTVPARVRFLSIEPMLGPIDFYRTSGAMQGEAHPWSNGPILQGIHWVIVGGESGHVRDIRPMHPQWARDLRDQCATAGVPFLFKQHGEWREPMEGEAFDTSMGGAANPPAFIVSKVDGTVHCFHSSRIVDGKAVIRVGKKAAGRLLDGCTHDGFPGGA